MFRFAINFNCKIIMSTYNHLVTLTRNRGANICVAESYSICPLDFAGPDDHVMYIGMSQSPWQRMLGGGGQRKIRHLNYNIKAQGKEKLVPEESGDGLFPSLLRTHMHTWLSRYMYEGSEGIAFSWTSLTTIKSVWTNLKGLVSCWSKLQLIFWSLGCVHILF